MSIIESIFQIYTIAFEIIEKHTILVIVANIESFAIFYMLKEAKDIAVKKMKDVKERVLQRCTYDTKYRNRIASFIFFFSDMGPSVSSFSVIALFITTDENVIALTFVFVCGIIMKEIFREFKNKFYVAIEKRSS